jgi:hypothetical protein
VRAAALLVAALALALPATAAAQTAQPVVGGGSFNAAQTLTPGTYRDTLLTREFLYYAVRLAPGQRLHVTIRADTDPATFRSTTDLINIVAFGPLRNELMSSHTSITDPGKTAELTTEPAGQDEVADGGTPQPGPGRYYVALFSNWLRATEPPKAEVPITFTIAVEDATGAKATPTPSPTPTPKPTPEPTVVASGGGGGPDGGVLAGSAVAGLLVGAVAATAFARRRRPA